MCAADTAFTGGWVVCLLIDIVKKAVDVVFIVATVVATKTILCTAFIDEVIISIELEPHRIVRRICRPVPIHSSFTDATTARAGIFQGAEEKLGRM